MKYTRNEHRQPSQPGPIAATLERIVSGGQTGVDRGALDAALERGFPIGGWVPKGRMAEDGIVPGRYGALRESSRPGYHWRTERNIIDSDATLILAPDPDRLSGGTLKTLVFARNHRKPVRVSRAAPPFPDLHGTVAWLGDHAVRVLNVAGPRESRHPGIQKLARDYVGALLDHLAANHPLCTTG